MCTTRAAVGHSLVHLSLIGCLPSVSLAVSSVRLVGTSNRPNARWTEDVIVPRAVLRAPETFGGTPEGDGLRGRAVVLDDREDRHSKASENNWQTDCHRPKH